MSPNGALTSDDIRALMQAHEQQSVLVDGLRIRFAEIDERQRRYQEATSRAFTLMDTAVVDWRKETDRQIAAVRADYLRDLGKIAATLDRLTSDDMQHSTTAAGLAEQVRGLNRQMLYQSIGGAAALGLIIALLVITLLVLKV